MFPLKDLPKYEAIRARATRYPEIDAGAVEAFLFLLRVSSDVMTAAEKYLIRHKLSHASFSVLMILNREPTLGLTPSDLASRCGVTRATMTGLLDGLQRKKLIRRESHQVDRRTILVRLNKHGIDLLESMLHDYYRRLALMMGGLEDKKCLTDMLLQVSSGIDYMQKP
jgi:DNA-binding MarR family transcriptional regulator